MFKLMTLALVLSSVAFAIDPGTELLQKKINAEKEKMAQVIESVTMLDAPWYETPSGTLLMIEYYEAAENIITHFENAANGMMSSWSFKLGREYKNRKECLFAEVKELECNQYMESEMRAAAKATGPQVHQMKTRILPEILRLEKKVVLFVAPETLNELNTDVAEKIKGIGERAKKARSIFEGVEDFLEARKLYQVR